MAIAYLIESNDGSGPVYYAPDVGRNTGHGMMGWTADKDLALGFASEQDVKRFTDALMPRLGTTLRPVPHRRPD